MTIAPIDATERSRRVARVQAELRRRDLAAAVLTERANFEYVTGYWVPPLWSSFTRVLAAIVPADGDPVLLLPAFVAGAGAETTGWRVEPYATLERGAGELLAEVLRGMNLAAERIGVERGRESRLATTVDELNRLAAAMPTAPGLRRPTGRRARARRSATSRP